MSLSATPFFVVNLALAVAAPAAPERAVDPCDDRATVDALRAADDKTLPALRDALTKRRHAAAGEARACLAALEAEAAFALGDVEATAALLDEAKVHPALAAAADAHRVLLLAKLGRLDEATALAAATAATTSKALAAKQAAYLAHAQAKDGPSAAVAIAAWRALADASPADAPRALDEAYALAVAQKDAAAQKSAAEALLLRHPKSQPALRLESDVDKRGWWGGPRRVERVKALLKVARPHRAVVEALAVDRKRHKPDALVALEEQTLIALVRAARTDEAVARARAWALDALSPNEKAQAHKAIAWTVGKAANEGKASLDDVVDAWDRAEAAAVSPAAKDDARFQQSFALYEAGQYEAALSRRCQAQGQAAPACKGFAADADTVDSAWPHRWYAALCLLLLNRHAEAEPLLAILSAQGAPDEQLKARYWRAVSLQALGRPDDARALFLALARDDATDWYGLLTRERLGVEPPRGVKLKTTLPVPDDADARLTRTLYATGFDAEAKATLLSRKRDLGTVGLAQHIEHHLHGYRLGGYFTPNPALRKNGIKNTPSWRASYPTPWPDLVEDAARRHGVPASFVWAIMRTESGFDPRAVSAAGARGLLQLLPGVARGVAARIGTSAAVADDIFVPAHAIDLGTALLALRQQEYGSLMLAAAAYNAAPEEVARWQKDFGGLDVPLFVERVPFKETRDYIKRVLAVEATYRALAGAPLALELPKAPGAPPQNPVQFPYDE